MKIKKYLETAEDVLALKDTDTKIYVNDEKSYYKFVKGILCYFNAYNGITCFNSWLDMDEDVYILEEEKEQQKVSDKDRGKLCWFWHYNEVFGEGEKEAGIFDHMEGENYRTVSGFIYSNCKRMTPSEVEEVTGYKVSFADQSDAKVEEK